MEPKAWQVHVACCAALVENAKDAADPSNVCWGDAVSAPTCVQRSQPPVLEGQDHRRDCRPSPVNKRLAKSSRGLGGGKERYARRRAGSLVASMAPGRTVRRAGAEGSWQARTNTSSTLSMMPWSRASSRT